MNSRKIKVVLADDHFVVRMGVAAALAAEPDLEVVGEAADGLEAIRLAHELKPDVIVMDLMMPVLNGAEATARIAAAAPHANVLILTSYGSADDIGRALDAGARGAVIKTISNEALADAIRKVADGQVCVDPEISKMLKSEPPVPELTERQRDILLSAARGLTNEEIARQFGITASAVKQHLSSVFAKLGVANRAEAVSYALRKQLLKA